MFDEFQISLPVEFLLFYCQKTNQNQQPTNSQTRNQPTQSQSQNQSQNHQTKPEMKNRDAYFLWMRELSAEAVRRGGLPLGDDHLTKSVCCWVEDFDKGLSPAEALDKNELIGQRSNRRDGMRPDQSVLFIGLYICIALVVIGMIPH